MSIARPRAPHLSLPFTSLFLASIWSVSVMIATPALLYSTTISYDDDNMEARQVLSTLYLHNALHLLDFWHNIFTDLPVWWSGLTATPACLCWIIIIRFLNCPFLLSLSPQMPPKIKRLYCIVCFHCKLSKYFSWLLSSHPNLWRLMTYIWMTSYYFCTFLTCNLPDMSHCHIISPWFGYLIFYLCHEEHLLLSSGPGLDTYIQIEL